MEKKIDQIFANKFGFDQINFFRTLKKIFLVLVFLNQREKTTFLKMISGFRNLKFSKKKIIF
jgi:hypothetical protein